MVTRAERAQQEAGGEIGAWGGMAGGAVAGYKGTKGFHRVKHGASGARASYRGSRELTSWTGASGGRLKDVGTALKTGAAGAVKAPKKAVIAAAPIGVLGAAAGTIGGAHAGKKLVARHQQRKKVGKSMTMEQIAKAGYQLNPKADKKSAQRHSMAQLGALGASGVGGGMVGHKAGTELAERMGHDMWVRGKPATARSIAGHLPGAYKSALKSKTGAIGAGLGAAGIAGSAAVKHSAKKKGIIVPKKKVAKSYTSVSAFGVDHGY
jgi:hypothetical protein